MNIISVNEFPTVMPKKPAMPVQTDGECILDPERIRQLCRAVKEHPNGTGAVQTNLANSAARG